MKKILSIFLVLLVAGSTVYARRTEVPTTSNGVEIIKTGSLVKVLYKASSASDVKVSIYNDAEKLVFQEVIKKVDGFIRPYNFSELPYGEYTIEVADANQRTVERVDYQKESVKHLAKVVRVKDSENKYLLMVPNKTSNKLTIRIYDAEGDLLHIEEKNTSTDFAGLYNLAGVKNKFYFLITDAEGNVREVVY